MNSFDAEKQAEKLMIRGSAMFGKHKDVAKKHLQIAADNISDEINGKILKEYGVVSDSEAKHLVSVFEKAMVDYMTEYVEWVIEEMVKQFQNIAIREIRRISIDICSEYIKNKDISGEEMKRFMESLFKNKRLMVSN